MRATSVAESVAQLHDHLERYSQSWGGFDPSVRYQEVGVEPDSSYTYSVEEVTKHSEAPACPSEPRRLLGECDVHAVSACHMAAYRARESLREDSLFNDPYARILAGQCGDFGGKGENTSQRCRTRFFDDFVELKYRQGVRQFVFLGAGMDTRAYRMETIEDAHFFEVDKQPVFEMKEPLLRSAPVRCAGRHVIALDLSAEHDLERLGKVLAGQGYDAKNDSVWLLEGLIMYLSPDSAKRLLRKVSKLSGTGSAILFDCCMTCVVQMGIQVTGAPWLSGLSDYVDAFPKAHLSIMDVISFERFEIKDRKLLIKLGAKDGPKDGAKDSPSVPYELKFQTIRDDCRIISSQTAGTAAFSGYMVTLNRSMSASKHAHRFARGHKHFHSTGTSGTSGPGKQRR